MVHLALLNVVLVSLVFFYRRRQIMKRIKRRNM